MDNYLEKVALFSSLKESELKTLCAAATKKQFPQEEVLIREGELADCLYIIVQGSVQVFTTDKNDETVVLARLDEGVCFGEQAYLYNFIRTASVKALTDVELIKISYDALDQVFKTSDKLRKSFEKAALLKSIENLQTQSNQIDDYVKDIFTKKGFFSSEENAVIENYKKDEIIFNKGDPATTVYFVAAGSVKLLFDEADANSYQIVINKNRIFGEMGVLENKPRMATAKANTDTTVIAVTAKNFLKATKSSVGIQSLIATLNNVYSLPKLKATVEQFVGKINGADAVFSRYKLHSGQIAECAHVTNQPIFTMKILDVVPDTNLVFQKGELITRKIMLKNNIIVGIDAMGEWDEINVLCEMLLNNIEIQEASKGLFTKNGNMLAMSSNSDVYKNDVICNCMVVPYQTIKEKIDGGCNKLEEISQETGACTACGSCRNKILDILGQGSWISAKIQLHQQFNQDTCSFLIKPIYNQLPTFSAGQYLSVKLQIDGLWLERTYTLVSSTFHTDHYEIIVRKHAAGKFSPWLFEHTKSPVFIWISRPGGKFLLKTAAKKSIFCFAGGIGITPFIAFIRNMQHLNNKNKLHVLYLTRNEKDIAIPADVYATLKQSELINIEFWDSATNGTLDADTIEKKLKNADPEYIYICGSPGFQDAIVKKLNDMNYNAQNIITEEFVPAAGLPSK